MKASVCCCAALLAACASPVECVVGQGEAAASAVEIPSDGSRLVEAVISIAARVEPTLSLWRAVWTVDPAVDTLITVSSSDCGESIWAQADLSQGNPDLVFWNDATLGGCVEGTGCEVRTCLRLGADEATEASIRLSLELSRWGDGEEACADPREIEVLVRTTD